MQVIPTEIPDVKVLVPKKFGDHRGFFSETFNRKTLRDLGIGAEFVEEMAVDRHVIDVQDLGEHLGEGGLDARDQGRRRHRTVS